MWVLGALVHAQEMIECKITSGLGFVEDQLWCRHIGGTCLFVGPERDWVCRRSGAGLIVYASIITKP